MMIRHEREQCVVVLPDGTELFGEVETEYDRKSLACDAVRKSGATSPRKKPQSVAVNIFRLRIEKGKLVRHLTNTVDVDVPLEPMTEAEFREEMDSMLARLPPEFARRVDSEAWERGHSNGYEEVIGCADRIADWLEPAIAEYTKRITAKSKAAK